MKSNFFMFSLAGILATLGAIVALSSETSSRAAPKPACLSRPVENAELTLAELHAPWRYLYIPDTDPSRPLAGSAPLRAAALGLAHDLAEGSLTADAVTPALLAERAIECGYPEALAVGGRGIAVGKGWTPEQALMLMTFEYAGGIRVPNYVDGQEMRCIGLAHATEPGASPGEAWVIIIMAGEPGCPQTAANVQPYAGGSPTPTPAPPFVRPTATPTTKPAIAIHRLFIPVARD